MNVAAIFVGIGDAVTFNPVGYLSSGEWSATAYVRKLIGGQGAADAAAGLQSNGFYTFGGLWGGAALGGGGARAGRVLWSGMTPAAAERAAVSLGGKTLEMTKAGRLLTALTARFG